MKKNIIFWTVTYLIMGLGYCSQVIRIAEVSGVHLSNFWKVLAVVLWPLWIHLTGMFALVNWLIN